MPKSRSDRSSDRDAANEARGTFPTGSATEVAKTWGTHFHKPDLWIRVAEATYESRAFSWTVRALAIFLLGLSPSFAKPRPFPPSAESLRRLFWRWFFFAVAVCLLGTVAATALQGTLAGSDPTRRYFRSDGWNLFLYTFVCPTYVAGCRCVIEIAASRWFHLHHFANTFGVAKASWAGHARRNALFWSLFALLALATVALYIHDALQPPKTFSLFTQPLFGKLDLKFDARTYWFADRSPSGSMRLNGAGWYYATLNLALLAITMIGIPCYFSVAYETLRIARIRSFRALEEQRRLIQGVVHAYHYARVIAAAYIVNYLVWGLSPLGGTRWNMGLALAALFFFGGQLMAFPIAYLEFRWNELRTADRRRTERRYEEQFDEIDAEMKILSRKSNDEDAEARMERIRLLTERREQLANSQKHERSSEDEPILVEGEQRFHKVVQYLFWGVLTTAGVGTLWSQLLQWIAKSVH